jgi:non-specific serine/threonine protein kinase
MLETIREYAAEMLGARDEAGAIADRHGSAMLALAERAAPELSGPDQRIWLERLERDHDNVRAALDWAIAKPDPTLGARLSFAIWRFWQQRGYLNEARTRFEQLEAQGWRLDAADRARFAEAFGGIAYWQSDHPTATRLYDEQLRLWREIGDQREIANALYNRAYADMIEVMGGNISAPDVETARARLNEALDIYRGLGDTGGEGNILWGLGSMAYFNSDAAEAEDWYRRSLELHRKAGNRTMEAWSLHMLALSMVGKHQFAEAKEIGQHALQHFYESGDVSGVTLSLDDIGLSSLGTGDVDRAGRLWGAARRLQETTGTALADYVDQMKQLFDVSTPKDVLPPERLEVLAAEGAAMPYDELVAYALETSGSTPPTDHPETAG